jgi:hypothetical protein
MDQQEDISKEREYELRPIKLEPGIYDFTIPIRNYIEKDIPFSDEQINVLRTFDRDYSFQEDIAKRGKGAVLSELNKALRGFDFEEAKSASEEGLKMAQVINPDIPIKPFPIVFLFNPFRGDAKSLHGQGCGINIMYLKSSTHQEESTRQKIVTFTAHEAVHVFLKQLGMQPEYKNKGLEKSVLDFLWEEGLTTYVEPTHYLPHDIVENDGDYWVDIINRWFDSDDIKKKEIYKEILERQSFQYWYNYMYNSQPLPYDWGSTDENFWILLTKRNGLAYHIGSYLWKREINKAKKEGKEIKDLVMAGSDEMVRWMEGV